MSRMRPSARPSRSGHFADLNVNPTFGMKDLKAVPAEWRSRIPEYVKDYVSLNQFL